MKENTDRMAQNKPCNPFLGISDNLIRGGAKNASKRNTTRFGGGRSRCMNKTEHRFMLHLLSSVNTTRVLIIAQPTRFFRFDNGDTYTPDFLCIERLDDETVKMTSWEVKGGYKGPGWEQGLERFKRAREQFGPYGIVFGLATWNSKKEEWEFE